MSGQFPESYAILRVGIEQAWYALHIAKDPHPPERVTVWLRRNDDQSSKSRCKNEFTVQNVRSTHESIDSVTAKQLHELYEKMIDYGAHPNQISLFAAMSESETEQETTFTLGILFREPVPILATLQMAVAVAVGALEVFHRVFPERFRIMSLDREIKALVGELNSAFKMYVQQ